MTAADQGNDENKPGKPDKDEPGKKKRKRARKKGEKRPKPEPISRGRRLANLIWSIAHPMRRRILRAFASRRKPCTPAQIAAQLDLSLRLVTYHTNVLDKFGAVEHAAGRPAGGTVEDLFGSRIDDAQTIETLLEETREADEEEG